MLLVLAVVALVLWGGDMFPTEKHELKFTYHAFGGEGFLDQTLEINNTGLRAVVPTLKITPLDKFGAEIPGLTVSSAFGSERGGRVLPSLWTDWEVLKFDGPRAGDVRDVRVEVTHLKQVDYPDVTKEVTIKRYDDGKPVDSSDKTFDAIELENPNKDAMPTKIALIGWQRAKKGTPQQFEWAIPLEQRVVVPKLGHTMVKLPDDLADDIIVSVLAYQVR